MEEIKNKDDAQKAASVSDSEQNKSSVSNLSGKKEFSEEKQKVEKELLAGDFLGKRSPAKLFWGYLVCGSLFWLVVFFGVGMAFTYRVDPNFETAGLALLICAVILYLWGFVFSVLSFMAALRIKGKPFIKTLYIVGIIAFMIVLFSGLLLFVHLAMVV